MVTKIEEGSPSTSNRIEVQKEKVKSNKDWFSYLVVFVMVDWYVELWIQMCIFIAAWPEATTHYHLCQYNRTIITVALDGQKFCDSEVLGLLVHSHTFWARKREKQHLNRMLIFAFFDDKYNQLDLVVFIIKNEEFSCFQNSSRLFEDDTSWATVSNSLFSVFRADAMCC